MDKIQRELINTYFRKRALAVNNIIGYSNHELDFHIRNNSVDLTTISPENMVYVLEYYPQLISKLNLRKLQNNHRKIIRILIGKPELFDTLNNVLNFKTMFSGEDISDLLSYRPELIDKLDLEKLVGENLETIIIYDPSLIDKLIKNLDDLSIKNVNAILKVHPQLEPYFRNHIRAYNTISKANV